MTHSIHQIRKDIIVCSEEEIKFPKVVIPCHVYNSLDNDYRMSTDDYDDIKQHDKKIISSNCGIGLPLTNSIENLNQLWEEFESEKLALKEFPKNMVFDEFYVSEFDSNEYFRNAFIAGRKSKQGVYTLEDMYMLASKVVGDIAKNYSNADWNLFTTPKMIADEFISQLSIHEGKVSCEITNDSITVTKYL